VDEAAAWQDVSMDRAQAAALRDLLATLGPGGWVEASAEFGAALRRAPKRPGALLLTGPADDEPWHLAAHLTEEARWSGAVELSPVLVRHNPPSDAPAHLAVGLERLRVAERGEALLVVAEQDPADAVLERIGDARKRGARILALDQGAAELRDLAHEALTVPSGPGPLTFDSAQHLVSLATAEQLKGGLRARFGRWIDAIGGRRVEQW
jgi:hypothetical protein